MSKFNKYIYHLARFLAALILLQTLYFKFGGAEESIYIFTKVGMEPWGRYLTGVVELIASVFLIISSVSWIGAILGLGLMVGAIGMHLTLLGIEVQNDGGYLFALALIVFLSCLYVLWYKQDQVRAFLKRS